MSEKENNILNGQFFDTKLFVIDDTDETLKNTTGSNQKKLCIVCKTEEVSSEDLEFLKKILSAVKYDLKEDVLLVSITQNQALGFSSIRTNHNIKDAIIFGINPQSLGLHFKVNLYQPFSCNQCRFLFAHSLKEIANKKEWKGALWTALQEMFLNKEASK